MHFPIKIGFALDTCAIERRKVDKKKSKPTRKLKHANSILDYFEYFCQMSSKSIAIILSYTVSNFARLFETQCVHVRT